MRRPIAARSALRPYVFGLLLGGVASIALSAVVLGAAADARTQQIAPRAVLEATHLPPLLVVPGENVKLAFDVHCASFGVVDPEQACPVTGSLFVRAGSTGSFRAESLVQDDADGLHRLVALVPGDIAENDDGFEYYAEIAATGSGDRLRIPTGPSAVYHSYPMRDPIDVRLNGQPFGATRAGLRMVSAPWGDGPGDVGLESGRGADPIGASSFDVDASGALVLLDEAHRRALRWTPGAHTPEPVALAIDGRIADLAVGAGSSMYVLESTADSGQRPLVRSFDRAGRELGVIQIAEPSPAQIRMGPDGPVVLQHPSDLWTPVVAGGAPLSPVEQVRRGHVGRRLPSGSEVVTLRTGNELRLALVSRGRVQASWRVTSPAALGEVQLAEPIASRLVVVVRVYDDSSDEFRVLVLDRRGLVRQFSVASADWAETAPLSRFRVAGGSLFQLGSTPSGAFINRFDLEVR